jgi:hypothetical protein
MLPGDGTRQISGIEVPESKGFAAQLSDNGVNTKVVDVIPRKALVAY